VKGPLRALTIAATALLLAVVAVRVVLGAVDRGAATATAEAVPGAGPNRVRVETLPDGSRRVEHALGTAIVPARPLRVAALGFTDELLALDVEPVVATGLRGVGFEDFFADRLVHTKVLDDVGTGPDLEAIAAAKPDLIIADWWFPQADFARVGEIAPAVALRKGDREWRERLLDIADVLGRHEDGVRRVALCEARLAEARRRVRAVVGDHTVAMLRIFAREYRLYGLRASGTLLYDELGLSPPPIVKDVAGGSLVRLSLEGLVDLDADYILLMNEPRIRISARELATLVEQPLWARLPAVRAGHVYPVHNLLMRGGVLARERMAERLADALEERAE
jgi:iron complex transport system substrate-binding protein